MEIKLEISSQSSLAPKLKTEELLFVAERTKKDGFLQIASHIKLENETGDVVRAGTGIVVWRAKRQIRKKASEKFPQNSSDN